MLGGGEGGLPGYIMLICQVTSKCNADLKLYLKYENCCTNIDEFWLTLFS